MIGFKQFLAEVWSRPKALNRPGREHWQHDKDIVGHQIGLSFSKYPSENNHTVNYDVNGSFRKEFSKTKPEANQKILKHVDKHLNQFIRHRKPTGLRFYSPNAQKTQLHKLLAAHLARNHGGKVKEHGIGGGLINHIVSFDRDKK